MKNAIALLAALLVSTMAAHAQGQPANCHGMLTATLASGRPHGDLSQCGPEMIPHIVRAMERSHGRADTVYVTTLVSYASDYRHPAVFGAAIELADDRSAPRAARMDGLLILSSQFLHNLAPKGDYSSLGVLLTREVPLTCQ